VSLIRRRQPQTVCVLPHPAPLAPALHHARPLSLGLAHAAHAARLAAPRHALLLLLLLLHGGGGGRLRKLLAVGCQHGLGGRLLLRLLQVVCGPLDVAQRLSRPSRAAL
jgi:hypothetical protein